MMKKNTRKHLHGQKKNVSKDSIRTQKNFRKHVIRKILSGSS